MKNKEIYRELLNENDFKEVFKIIVEKTSNYVKKHNLKEMVLGISGGIDSTVVAAIAHEVSKDTNIPLKGRSLTIKNKTAERSTSILVGKAFCNDFKEVNMATFYRNYLIDLYLNEYNVDNKSEEDLWSLELSELENLEPFKSGKISNGNIMARLRMSYLYDLAGRDKGLVLDTDNLTEHYLGFWTLHGDEGDFNPIGGLWKTEVYGLAKYIRNNYTSKGINNLPKETGYNMLDVSDALDGSIDLIPTDGNGISSSDLEQIGGKDYFEVDKILVPLVLDGYSAVDKLKDSFSMDTINRIYNRYESSEFKRRTNRTIKITREEIYESMNK